MKEEEKKKRTRVPENVQGNFLKGTLEMMVLMLLSQKYMKPSQLKRELEEDGAFFLSNLNVVYNIFDRLENDGYIMHVTMVHAGNRYCLTPEGVEYLQFLRHEYNRIDKKVKRLEVATDEKHQSD